MVWAVTYLIPSSLRFSCHRQWVTHRGLSKGSIETLRENSASSGCLCIIFSSIHGLPKQEWAVSNVGGRVPSVEEKAPWCMYWEGRSSLKRKAQSGRAYGVWIWECQLPWGMSQGRGFLTVCKLVIFSIPVIEWELPGVFSVSFTNTMKSLSHESHPSCVCCHTSIPLLIFLGSR